MIVDDSILLHDNLLHAYDPVKAREYYLRTRKLKGRKKGSEDNKGDKNSGSVKPSGTKKSPVVKKRAKQKRAETEAKVAALKKRLERLKEVLSELVKEAKARSGVKDESPKAKADQNEETKARKPLTSAQKKAQAERAKKAYEKEKKQSPDQELKELQEKIKDIRAKIKAAIADADKNKKPASKGRTR